MNNKNNKKPPKMLSKKNSLLLVKVMSSIFRGTNGTIIQNNSFWAPFKMAKIVCTQGKESMWI